jgi:hypothetical protein
MRIDVTQILPARLLEPAWDLYNAAFAELRATAVQRHLMTRAEFEEMMHDSRVRKYVGVDSAGRLAGLATFTNHLDAVPLISPDYFQFRWPVHFAERRIWYVGFVAVHPGERGTGTFEAIVAEMYRSVEGQNAIVGLDVCRRNEDYGLPKAIHSVLSKLDSGVRRRRVDEQSYWLYEFDPGRAA